MPADLAAARGNVAILKDIAWAVDGDKELADKIGLSTALAAAADALEDMERKYMTPLREAEKLAEEKRRLRTAPPPSTRVRVFDRDECEALRDAQ